MKITMQQIADMAGVSRRTVDKVLHNRGGVSETVRREILNLVEETGYRRPQERNKPDIQKDAGQIAFVRGPLSDPFQSMVERGVKQARYDYTGGATDLRILASPTHCEEDWVPLVRKLEEKPPDGIIIQGYMNEALEASLNNLAAMGIPIVFFDCDNLRCDRLCYIGADSIEVGRIAASLLAKRIKKKGKIALIGGNVHNQSHVERLTSFQALMQQQYPEIEMLDVLETMEPQKIYDYVRKTIKTHPDLAGIYVAIGFTTSVARAVVDEGRSGKIGVVGCHNAGDTKAMVDVGIVDFALDLSPYMQGYQAFYSVYHFLTEGWRPAVKTYDVPVRIMLDESNDLDEIDPFEVRALVELYAECEAGSE